MGVVIAKSWDSEDGCGSDGLGLKLMYVRSGLKAIEELVYGVVGGACIEAGVVSDNEARIRVIETGVKWVERYDAFDERLMVCSSSTSEGPCRSEPIECSNCKVKDLTINKLESRNRALKARLRMLEARLEMERNPKDHACQSGAILNELLDDMEDLHME
ncbi:hypothetical protein Tco_0661731 [Tanacetum coccineum]